MAAVILIASALGVILLTLYACIALSARESREEERRERERSRKHGQE